MARPKKVEIVHVETGIRGHVLPESLPAWFNNGWTTLDDESGDEEFTLFSSDIENDPDEPGIDEE